MAEDTFGATEGMPAYLNLSHEVFMGKNADFDLVKGTASKIPTGGMLPGTADSVVMFEYVQVIDEKMIEVLRPVAPGENVIQAGEDAVKGEPVLRVGRRLRPHDIGACAGLGITDIWAYKRPSVSILSTGDEIVPAESLPDIGQMRYINSYVLAGMITENGGIPLKKGILRDEYGTIRTVIESSMSDSDVILISGGTSVGIKDMVARIINDIGNPGVIFHGVSLKPGKPMIGGIMNGIPVFGLPGHPAAVSVCFDIFIRPVLRLLSGVARRFNDPGNSSVKAKLAKNVSSSQGREEYIRVMLEERGDSLWAVPILGKSGLITTLVQADGTIVIPLNASGLEQGETVDVRLL
jgi:molybdopterin molybdotransferase